MIKNWQQHAGTGSNRRDGRSWLGNSVRVLTLICTLTAATSVAEPGDDIKDPELNKLGAKVVATGWKSSWSPDGKEIVYGGSMKAGRGDVLSGLLVLNVETGKVRQLSKVGKDPAWSPGKGEHIAYAAGEDWRAEEVWIMDRDGANPTKLADGGFPVWCADPNTLYYQSRKQGKLMKIRIGAEKPVPEEVMKMSWWYPAISLDGRYVAYRQGPEIRIADLASGEIVKRVPLANGRGFLGGWSPDGRYLCYGGYGEHDLIGLHLADLRTGKVTRLSKGSFTMADWSRDGSKIAVDHRLKGSQHVCMLETEALGDLLAKPVAEKAAEVDPDAVKALVKQLGDEDFKVREKADKALLEIGSPAKAALEEAAKSPDNEIEVKLRARKLIEQILLKARFGG